MFLLLIVLVTILIFALRLTLMGTELAGRVALREIRRAKKAEKKKVKEGKKKNRIKTTALNTTKSAIELSKGVVKSGIRLLIFALQWLRGALISLALVFFVYDVILFAILVAGAGGAYVLFYADDANNMYLNANSSQTSGSTSNGSSVNLNNLNWDSISDDKARACLQEIAQSWGSEVTDKRAKLIILGATRIGKSTYSWGNGRGGSADDQSVFDCSSFVGWCYYKSGYTSVSPSSTTASFIDSSETGKQFERISADELIPGDVALWKDTYGLYNANHAGIYVGKNKDGKMMFMHCTSRAQSSPHPVSTGVRFSEYGMQVFLRMKNW